MTRRAYLSRRYPMLIGLAMAILGMTSLAMSQSPPARALIAAPNSPLGTGPVCDEESTELCLSANGTDGNYVYSKTYNNDMEEHTTVSGALVCGGTDVVDGGNSNCPFKDGSGLNAAYKNDLIIYLHNSDENNVYYSDDISNILQETGSPTSSDEYVLVPDSGHYDIVSVAASNSQGASWHVCNAQANGLVDVTSQWYGGGSCIFTMP